MRRNVASGGRAECASVDGRASFCKGKVVVGPFIYASAGAEIRGCSAR